MKQKMKQLMGILLGLALVLGLMAGMTMTALAAYGDTSYTLTIPSTLTVSGSGWNATDGISATGTLEDSKKLTVTASSDDEFALVNQSDGTQKVSYKLAESGDTNTTYANATEKTSWEFTTLSSTAATQPMGIVVEDYSTKPAGTYQDTVTFTASVGSAYPTLDNTTTAWTAGTFVVPGGGLTYRVAVTVSGDVTLVLTDGETLTLNKGISIASGATLTVKGTGTMNVNGTSNSTASTVAGTGTLVLMSGMLNATGGNGQSLDDYDNTYGESGGVAINGNVTIDGGTVTANGGNGQSLDDVEDNTYGGSGGVAIDGNVTIDGGTVTANGGNGGNCTIRVFGGIDNVIAGNGGAAISGSVTVNAGTWTATNGSNGTENISDGSVNCKAGNGAAAVAGTVTDNR